MKNELTILEQLRVVLQSDLNDHLEEGLEGIQEGSVVVDFPDTDLMRFQTVLYIQPNWADYESLSTQSDSSVFNVSIFILCKRDRKEELTRKIYGYFNAVYSLLRNDISLGGMVDFTDVDNAEFYPAVEGNRNVQGVEISVSIRYTKDF